MEIADVFKPARVAAPGTSRAARFGARPVPRSQQPRWHRDPGIFQKLVLLSTGCAPGRRALQTQRLSPFAWRRAIQPSSVELMRLLASSALFLVATACPSAAPDIDAPLRPDKEAATFRFADPNLTAELVAAEPDVVAPVAIAWDADGRMFVAEMTDYPSGPVSGRIQLLEDRDGDGRYEHSTVFATNLAFPNGVMAWKNGVLVTAAPDIWFLADTNGDGEADVREKVLTGFAE